MPTSFLIYGHISIQTWILFLNLYNFFHANIICLDLDYSFHTVWLYHRHRLFSQTHKTFSWPLHVIPIIYFSHILRILSHTSLYHINNYRSIQTYILFIIPSTFFHTFLLFILTTLIWIKYTSHTYTPIYSSNPNVTHRPKFFIHIFLIFIDILD